MPICRRCCKQYHGAECPHCRDRTLWEAIGGYVLLALLVLGVGLMGLCIQGCSSGGARQVLVTATKGVKEMATVQMPLVCDLVEKRCIAQRKNPCQALLDCHKAEALISKAARYWHHGAQIANEVIPDGK